MYAHPLTFPDNDNIDLFARAPADHRRYLAFAYYIQHAYGSLETFVQVKRLNWIDLTPKGAPFTNTGQSNSVQLLRP